MEPFLTEDELNVGFAALEALPEAIVITNTDQIITFVNAAACRLLDITPASVLGTPLTQLSADRKSNRILSFRSFPICEGEQRKRIGLVIRINDITGEPAARELLSAMFNDMATPVSFIKGCADVLLEELSDSLAEEQRKWLARISEKAGFLWTLREETMKAASKQFQSVSGEAP